MEPIVQMSGITKRFPGVVALDHINLVCARAKDMFFWGKTVPENPP